MDDLSEIRARIMHNKMRYENDTAFRNDVDTRAQRLQEALRRFENPCTNATKGKVIKSEPAPHRKASHGSRKNAQLAYEARNVHIGPFDGIESTMPQWLIDQRRSK